MTDGTFGASSGCLTDTLAIEDTQVMCGATLEGVHGFEDLSSQGITCSTSGGQSAFTLHCSGSLEQDPCTIDSRAAGRAPTPPSPWSWTS